MKILITGDFYTANSSYKPELFDITIKNLFNSADYRIVNLEAPITADLAKNKIIKTGPHLRMSEDTAINFLKELNVDCVTMANNHVLDYGVKGIHDTFTTLEKNNISYVGAGRSLYEAVKPLVIERNGTRVAIVNFCENEWSIASEDSPGSNPMDIIDNASQIMKAKKIADYVIVIVHGGHEYYNLPSPRMQRQYRFYADQGADIVVGHHTHCISGYEEYNEVPIYYSLGNFLFTKNNPNDEWYTGLVLELDLLNEKIEHKIHPVRQQKETFKLSLVNGEGKSEVLKIIKSFNEIIKDTDKLNDYWQKYIEKQSKGYLNMWSPLSFIKNKYVAGALRKLGINFMNKKGASLYLNLMRCEAHRDMSRLVLEKYLKK